MRVGVLCSRIRIEEKLLFEALTARGVAYEKLDDRTLVFNLNDPSPYQQYDVILERSINHSRALYALQMFNDWGITTINTAHVARICGDKCLTTQALLKHRVPVPHNMMAFTPEAALEAISRERVTFMIGPPTFFVALMEAPGFSPERVESLRLVSSGGAGVSPAFVTAATQRLRCRVKRTYGSTEAPTVATSGAADPFERARDTDGRAIGDVTLRVTDPANGRHLPPGEVGELWLRGPEVFVGYADPDQTRAAFHRGWFRTGDLATMDGEGWLTVVGRIKEVIIRGGENIAAAEVEAALEAHPAVSQAVAVGYPDDVLGERVAAFVVTGGGAFALDDCRSWFSQRGVARFKTPERVITVDSLPLLATGKPDRAALRRRLEDAR